MKFVSNQSKIVLDKPKFNCDTCLVSKKNLHKAGVFQELMYPHCCAYIGKAGSGKTTLLMSLLHNKNVYKKKFENILLVMPTNSRGSIKNFPEFPDNKQWDELNGESIDEIIDFLTQATLRKERTLLIMDDIASQLKSSRYVMERLKHLVFNRRHLKCFIDFTVQSYLTIPKDIRKNLTHCFIIGKPSKSEAEVLFQELFNFSKKDTMKLFENVFKKKHDYLFLSIESQKLFNQDQDEIIYDV